MASPPRLALYPGSFDPITNGHLDVIRRARRLFDRVEVAVGINTQKTSLLSVDERLQLIRSCTEGLEGVSTSSFEGLVVEHARARNAIALVRGVRQAGDLEYELQMFYANRRMHPDLDVVFFAPSEEHAFVSASIVREIHSWGGDIRSFVPPPVMARLRARGKSRGE